METKTARPSASGWPSAARPARTAAALSICLFLFSLAVVSPGRAGDYDFVYQTEWGATDVGESQARWSIEDDRFFMFGDFTASGLASVVADFSGHVSIRANRKDEGWQAEQLVIASRYGRETSLAETLFSEQGLATTTATPPPDEAEVYPITDQMRRGVTDPFSAMMTMLDKLKAGGVCEGVFQIYDGRRRAELSFTDLGTARLEKDRDFGFDGEVQVCGIVSRPLGGHRRNSRLTAEAPDPEKTKAFIAELAPGLMVPVRIEVELFFGSLITRLDLDKSRI